MFYLTITQGLICVGCGEDENDGCFCGEKYETLEELIEQETNN